MKKLLTLATILLLFSMTALADDVEKGEEGMYWQLYDSTRATVIMYQVDTVAEICFAAYFGIVEISCSQLAKRPEWASIITWVSTEK